MTWWHSSWKRHCLNTSRHHPLANSEQTVRCGVLWGKVQQTGNVLTVLASPTQTYNAWIWFQSESGRLGRWFQLTTTRSEAWPILMEPQIHEQLELFMSLPAYARRNEQRLPVYRMFTPFSLLKSLRYVYFSFLFFCFPFNFFLESFTALKSILYEQKQGQMAVRWQHRTIKIDLHHRH